MKNTEKKLRSRSGVISHIGIRGRLIIGFTLVVLVFLFSTVVMLYFIDAAKSDANDFIQESIPVNSGIVDMQAEVMDIEMHMQSYMFLHDISRRKKIENQLVTVDMITSTINPFVSKMSNSTISEKWTSLTGLLDEYESRIGEIFRLIDANEPDKAREIYLGMVLPLSDKINDAFNVQVEKVATKPGMLDVLRGNIKSDISDIQHQLRIIDLTIISTLVIACLLSWFIAMLTSKSILIPIHQAINVAQRIAKGDRNIDIVTTRTDETGKLLNAMSMMHDSIKSSEDTIKQNVKVITQACTTMVSTLDEVRNAVDAQSTGASEQASSINEITASIREIERSASQTMNKAKELGSVAAKTRKNGQLGLESIESSVVGMKSVRDRVQHIAQTILDLSKQTQQVGDITAVVNNLAQQSKMLALNASIEAAKAGDAGKGFAVVAAEVKNLAEQSEQSTSQVQKILEDIKVATEKAVMVTEEGTKGVDNGLEMIEKTGAIIRDLNDVIREATIASEQIEAAVRQESAGIEQITAGMNEINTVTASFVESVGQTTDAMSNLARVTHKLKSSVDTYNE